MTNVIAASVRLARSPSAFKPLSQNSRAFSLLFHLCVLLSVNAEREKKRIRRG
jgi:hypothetical protein